MRMSLAAYPLLKQEGGAIVNIGSMYSIFGSTIAPGYAASKGGVVALTRSFAASWARDGIRCNAVAPGWSMTNKARTLWATPEMQDTINRKRDELGKSVHVRGAIGGRSEAK